MYTKCKHTTVDLKTAWSKDLCLHRIPSKKAEKAPISIYWAAKQRNNEKRTRAEIEMQARPLKT